MSEEELVTYEREEVAGETTAVDESEATEADIDLTLPRRARRFVEKKIPKANRWTSKQLAQKFIAFIEVLCGVKLYPYQKNFAFRVICSVIDNDGETITALFSRQSGKTETIANVVSVLMVLLPRLGTLPGAQNFLPESMFNDQGDYMYAKGFWVGIFAPVKEQAVTTYDRIRDRLMNDESLEVLRSPDFRMAVGVNNGNTCALSNGSFVRCHSASDGSNIESKTYHFVIVEESQDVSDFKVNKSISPMTASTNGTMVFIGTANSRKGFFYNQIEQNKKREAAEGIKNHFQYDYRVAAKYNKMYAKKIKKEMQRLGYDSDEFKMAYRLIWILERGMFTTEDEFLGNADHAKPEYNKCAQPYELLTQPEVGKVYVAGLDVAKESDQTVLTILEVDYDNPVLTESSRDAYSDVQIIKQYRKRIVYWLVMQGNWEYQYEAIKDTLEEWGVTVVYMDSTGVGDPLADRLIVNLDHCLVVPYKFSIPSKSVMWKNLSQEIIAGRLQFPYGQKSKHNLQVKQFIHEMLNLEKGYVGQYLVCQHPAVRNAHDDYADSLALACLAAKEEGIVDLEVDSNPFFGR